MPQVRVTPLSTLLTIQPTHTWPLGSALSDALAAHTTEFPYGPWKWIRRRTSFTSHAPAISSFGCWELGVCLHASGGWVRETRWYQKGVAYIIHSPKSRALYVAHHPYPNQKSSFPSLWLFTPSAFGLLSPSVGMSLPLYQPSFVLPPPTPLYLIEDFQNSCSGGVDVAL